MIASFGIVMVGGPLSYHLLTSIVSCPTCTSRVINLGISADDANRKVFSCSKCGTSAYLTEGFYWQRD
jgi:DNA-directed RNA polymerase subunit RPC12/RpoP